MGDLKKEFNRDIEYVVIEGGKESINSELKRLREDGDVKEIKINGFNSKWCGSYVEHSVLVEIIYLTDDEEEVIYRGDKK